MDFQRVYFDLFGCRIDFGWNALDTLGSHIKSFSSKNALIVTGEGLFSVGFIEKVSTILKKAGIESVIFKDVSSNPTDADVQNGGRTYEEESCDLIIGVGGGSPMDAAKGIAILTSHKEQLR